LSRLVVGVVLLAVTGSAQSFRKTIAVDYHVVSDWLKLPQHRDNIGNMHGDIAVSSTGELYVSVRALNTKNQPLDDPMAGLQVYASNGSYERNVPGAPSDMHGFVIRKEGDTDYIYSVRLAENMTAAAQAKVADDVVFKMTLDGKRILSIHTSAIPDVFKSKSPDDNRPFLRLTDVTVAPNGDIYAADGYASNYIHQFSSTGKYIRSFGGPNAPYGLQAAQKFAIDTRFSPARLLVADGEHNRAVHLSLKGDFLGVFAKDLQFPAPVAIYGDFAAIGQLGVEGRSSARVTLLDKNGNVVATIGTNTTIGEFGTPNTEPRQWRSGIFTAPHGITFNDRGDMFVSEFNVFGRVHRFNLQERHVARQQ
jgi:hypothetical protein